MHPIKQWAVQLQHRLNKLFIKKKAFPLDKSEEPTTGRPRKKVMIIEEEVDLCLLMKTYFLRNNYEVYIEHQATQDVILKIGSILPDLVILDTSLCTDADAYIMRIKEISPYTQVHVPGTKRIFRQGKLQ